MTYALQRNIRASEPTTRSVVLRQGDADALASSSEAMEWILTSLVRVPEASELLKVLGMVL